MVSRLITLSYFSLSGGQSRQAPNSAILTRSSGVSAGRKHLGQIVGSIIKCLVVPTSCFSNMLLILTGKGHQACQVRFAS